jgi:hypothetical protein
LLADKSGKQKNVATSYGQAIGEGLTVGSANAVIESDRFLQKAFPVIFPNLTGATARLAPFLYKQSGELLFEGMAKSYSHGFKNLKGKR